MNNTYRHTRHARLHSHNHTDTLRHTHTETHTHTYLHALTHVHVPPGRVFDELSLHGDDALAHLVREVLIEEEKSLGTRQVLPLVTAHVRLPQVSNPHAVVSIAAMLVYLGQDGFSGCALFLAHCGGLISQRFVR